MYLFRCLVLSIASLLLGGFVSPAWSWPTGPVDWWRSNHAHPNGGDNHNGGSHCASCGGGNNGGGNNGGGHNGGGNNGGGNPDWMARNLATVSHIYDLTVYPHQVPIVTGGAAGVPPGLFSQNVVGRVDPVGDFVGFQDSIEYFFALAPLPQGNAAYAAITSFKITEFSSACAGIAASVVYLFCSVVNPGHPDDGKTLAPLKQVAFWKFDDAGAVLKYDAWIPNLNNWVEATNAAKVTNPVYQAQSIQQVCGATQLRCNGANSQWNSIEECIATLSQKPYGNYDEAWGDNMVCRTIHLVLTLVRPDVHCPHVGPTGGGKCIDVSYPENFFSDESLYDDKLGTTFMCNK